VVSVVPSSGPVSGVTSITMYGSSFPFPTTPQGPPGPLRAPPPPSQLTLPLRAPPACAVADAARCAFTYGNRSLYTKLRVLSPTQMTCMAPKLCDWGADGLTGRMPWSSSTPPRGAPCVFPFHYNGQAHTQCVSPTALPGFFDSAGNLSLAEMAALNSSAVAVCSLHPNMTASGSWAVCNCTALPAMQVAFAFTFNVFFLRYAPQPFTRFAFYYDLALYDISPKAGTAQGGTRRASPLPLSPPYC
jgi:hypothetical protein